MISCHHHARVPFHDKQLIYRAQHLFNMVGLKKQQISNKPDANHNCSKLVRIVFCSLAL